MTTWLTLHAIKNEADGTSRTFISVERESGAIAGYYCLSASSLTYEESDGKLRRNSPNPIPVILIGRLAVDLRFERQGVGASLLKHAMIKGLEATNTIGAKAFLVHALSDDAVSFYERFGFTLMPGNQRTMYLLIKDALMTIGGLGNT